MNKEFFEIIKYWLISTVIMFSPIILFSLIFDRLGILPMMLLLFLGSWFAKRFEKYEHRRSGRNLAKSTANLFLEPEHVFAQVEPRQFPWLDYSFYEQVTQEMQTLGFRAIADVEDCTISQSNPNQRSFFRVFIHPERGEAAICFHLNSRGFNAWLARRISGFKNDVKFIEFGSAFTDGGLADTNNAEHLPSFDQPVWRSQLKLPLDTSITHLYQAHQAHQLQYSQQHPHAERVRISSYADFLQVYQDEQRRSSEWRRLRGGIGVTAEELKRIAGPNLQDTAQAITQSMEEEGLLGKKQGDQD